MNLNTLYKADSLSRFLEVTEGNYRNSVYIETPGISTEEMPYLDILCAFDEQAMPVLVGVHDVEKHFGIIVDKSECLTVMSRGLFCAVYGRWLESSIFG